MARFKDYSITMEYFRDFLCNSKVEYITTEIDGRLTRIPVKGRRVSFSEVQGMVVTDCVIAGLYEAQASDFFCYGCDIFDDGDFYIASAGFYINYFSQGAARRLKVTISAGISDLYRENVEYLEKAEA